jgi:hypothetical protein
MNNPMTPEQALQILSDGLQPQMQGQITRSGYIAIDQALGVLAETIKKPEPAEPHDA